MKLSKRKKILNFILFYIYICLLIMLLSSASNLPLVIFCLIILISLIFIYKFILKKQDEEIEKISKKVIKLKKVNEEYKFEEIKMKDRRIREEEYSRKSLDRVTVDSIIKYHIENNINGLRTDIENAIYNIKLLNEYKEEVESISKIESINESKYSFKKFKKIENKVFNKLIYKKEDFLITIDLRAFYRKYNDDIIKKEAKISFEELVKFYNLWLNGNKYDETVKQERKIMNDNIRYNVLKRDNFKCQLCGNTVKDGAKLHVDHIIPVSKGGKTVMSNLQTLCDRCNIGKGNK